jgi:hypothetical protein
MIIGAIALIKANSSCVGRRLSAGTLFSEDSLLWRSVLVVASEKSEALPPITNPPS